MRRPCIFRGIRENLHLTPLPSGRFVPEIQLRRVVLPMATVHPRNIHGSLRPHGNARPHRKGLVPGDVPGVKILLGRVEGGRFLQEMLRIAMRKPIKRPALLPEKSVSRFSWFNVISLLHSRRSPMVARIHHVHLLVRCSAKGGREHKGRQGTPVKTIAFLASECRKTLLPWGIPYAAKVEEESRDYTTKGKTRSVSSQQRVNTELGDWSQRRAWRKRNCTAQFGSSPSQTLCKIQSSKFNTLMTSPP